MNRSMNILYVHRLLQEFERESGTMDMKDEILNDTMEDALGTEEDPMGDGIGESDESDAILKEVLDEIGVDLSQQVRQIKRRTTYSSCVMHLKVLLL